MPARAAKARLRARNPVLETLPWSSTQFGDHAEIETRSPETGVWETVATVYPVQGLDAEDIAAFMVGLANACGALFGEDRPE